MHRPQNLRWIYEGQGVHFIQRTQLQPIKLEWVLRSNPVITPCPNHIQPMLIVRSRSVGQSPDEAHVRMMDGEDMKVGIWVLGILCVLRVRWVQQHDVPLVGLEVDNVLCLLNVVRSILESQGLVQVQTVVLKAD